LTGFILLSIVSDPSLFSPLGRAHFSSHKSIRMFKDGQSTQQASASVSIVTEYLPITGKMLMTLSSTYFQHTVSDDQSWF